MVEQKPNYSEVRNVGYEENGQTYLPQTYERRSESLYTNDDGSVNIKDFIIGAFVGGVVGAATALFLAPKAGKELRTDVAVQASQFKEKSAGFTNSAKEKTVELSKMVQAQSGQLVGKVKSLKSTATPPFDDGTVSYEGEEPLDIMETMEKTIAEYEAENKEHTTVSAAIEEALTETAEKETK
ncbi:YtxH domain-containing protein [Rummeliibacillus sp. NPDC094406]|uniref:YtxH domain-containing protein n=1 Tax=Rummeliibacillus TaxID=648802 RepID=UPI0037C8C7EA